MTSRVAAPNQFIACVDSALQTGAMRRSELAVLGECLSAERRGLLALVDPTAESGLESIARVLLRPLAHSIRAQAEIPGIGRYGGTGRVDLLLDNWLVIELDCDEFHDPRVDRDRNATLVRLGYRIHRFGYEQVINNWPLVEATVRALLAVPPGKEIRDSRGRISF